MKANICSLGKDDEVAAIGYPQNTGGSRCSTAGHFPWKDVPDRYWPLVTEFVTTAPD